MKPGGSGREGLQWSRSLLPRCSLLCDGKLAGRPAIRHRSVEHGG